MLARPEGLPVANLFVAVSVIAPTLSAVHSGVFAARRFAARLPYAATVLVIAVPGTVLASLQLLVYAVIARQGRRTSLLLWVGLVAMVVVGATADSLTGLVVRVVAVDGVLLVVLLALSAWLVGRARTADATG